MLRKHPKGSKCDIVSLKVILLVTLLFNQSRSKKGFIYCGNIFQFVLSFVLFPYRKCSIKTDGVGSATPFHP